MSIFVKLKEISKVFYATDSFSTQRIQKTLSTFISLLQLKAESFYDQFRTYLSGFSGLNFQPPGATSGVHTPEVALHKFLL